MSKRILVIDDEPQMLLGLRDNLELEGYEVMTAPTASRAWPRRCRARPDLVILDLMLPRKSGFDVCRELRARANTTPVVMLTARSQETDKVLGLELGADDYLTKPFSIAELLARVARRAAPHAPSQPARRTRAAIGEVEMNFRTHQARRGEIRLVLTSREFDLLRLFRASTGRSGHPRPDPERGLGLRGGADHAHDRQLRGQAAAEDRA